MNSGTISIEKGKEFSDFLKRIHLGGLIQECVIVFKGGTATCQAVDLSNAVCVSQSVQIGSEGDITIGVGNLSTLCKFFAAGGEFIVSLDKDNSMTVKRKGHGQARFQLLEPKEVPTAIKPVDMGKQSKEKTKVILKATKVDDLLGFFNLLGCESVVFESKDGKLSASSSASDKEQFHLTLDKCKKDLRVVTYAKHFETVLKEMDKAKEINLFLQDGSALMLMQDEQFWLIAPIEE